MNYFKIVKNGIIKENPTFCMLIGMCPTLGTTTSAINGMGMGLCTMFVLILSNIAISLLKDFIPDKVRIPAFIVVIASFVTILQLCMQAYLPSLYESLGLYIPLIVVNCLILASGSLCKSEQSDSLHVRRNRYGLGLYPWFDNPWFGKRNPGQRFCFRLQIYRRCRWYVGFRPRPGSIYCIGLPDCIT